MINRASEGFSGGNFSTDGSLVVGDKGDSLDCECIDHPVKPSYVTESMPNFPHLTHEEALQLVGYQAGSQGASDGWTWEDDI